METQICETCETEKPINSFKPFVRKDGSTGCLRICGSCRYKECQNRAKSNIKLHHPVYFDSISNDWFKLCSRCNTPKPTKDFHKSKSFKDGIYSQCKSCIKEKDRIKYQQLTTEDKNALYKKRKEEGFKHSKNWRLNNLEKYREIHARYNKKPEQRAKARKRERDRRVRLGLEFYNKQRESLRRNRMLRRARERNCALIIPFTKADIIKRDGLRCYLCGVLTTEKNSHIEHILPISRGGNHKPENVKIACSFCNQSKGNKTLTEFKKYRGDYVRLK